MKKSLILAFLLFSHNIYAKNLKIATTIKPIFSIVKAVSGQNNQIDLLIETNNIHHAQLKPSHIKILNNADVVFFIDYSFESSFGNVLYELPKNVKQVSLLHEVDRLNILERRKNEDFEDDKEAPFNALHDHSGIDLHFYLSMQNAKKITNHIAKTLGEIDVENKNFYQENARKYTEKLDNLNKEIKAEFAKIDNKNFVVFHDNYQYFEKSFALKAKAAIALDSSNSASIVRIKEVRNKISQTKTSCVVYTKGFSRKLIDAITQDLNVKIVEMDAIGQDFENDEDLYLKIMRNLAQDFKKCLG